jgi:hypothetical protein
LPEAAYAKQFDRLAMWANCRNPLPS